MYQQPLDLGLSALSHDSSESRLAVDTLSNVLAMNADAEARGAVFTRLEVVRFILDLSGFHSDNQLYTKRILEPSFGNGDFLLEIVRRLLASWSRENETPPSFGDLCDTIVAVELHHETFIQTSKLILDELTCNGVEEGTASQLVKHWLIQGDFLLVGLPKQFDFVIGNPPYIRQELIPTLLLEEYRRRYETIYDRADIYIPFLERSLSLLSSVGVLGFICSDRWMKNRYGGPLRRFVSDSFSLKVYVDMCDTKAFHSDVIAYPAITLISREKHCKTRIFHNPQIEESFLSSLSKVLLGEDSVDSDVFKFKELANVMNGNEPWLLESSDQMEMLRRLEESYPLLEEAGCKVGIGVATGADKAFIGSYDSLCVEDDRKLPIVTTKDISSGEVNWRGMGVINPFTESGALVDLDEYPKLQQYLEERRSVIAARHCAKKTPEKWYRTIDRITPNLASTPKLLIPDIKGEAHVVFEEGKLYPHHNLYFILSEEWDLRSLQAVLLSSVARLFVASYSTKMRGGFLRFQAQYLRRIRIPRWDTVSQSLRDELSKAALARDVEACNSAVFKLYGLSLEEQSALGGNGK
ncbi:Eco57I restriction-modification methylase domain-containing protein [Marinomonas communis]|uniref:site-specific DNA-methyltransferase (adenine-specific) n=1 Tax=Marinomonas communis TaxID=28254 RepID=A0A4R6X0U1_9GAMM|nr:Eco57I restriction-modification methylase domain-containing protein [Marinomonas communis]TDR05599.1 methylase of polypeptide subunit release factors [Marinomonas communis]